MIPGARADLDEDQIDAVVRRFYARVRADPVIGPIFLDSLGTRADVWEAHEAKIARFWQNALLRRPVYAGNPMMVHAGISDLHRDHFAHWLSLFDAVLFEVLPPGTAQSWSRLAHRIGQGLSMGLEPARARASAGVPDLR